MSSQETLVGLSMSRGHTAPAVFTAQHFTNTTSRTAGGYPIPPSMVGGSTAVSNLTLVELPMVPRLEDATQSGSTTCWESDVDHDGFRVGQWSIERMADNLREEGGGFPPWVYQLAFGSSEESDSDYESEEDYSYVPSHEGVVRDAGFRSYLVYGEEEEEEEEVVDEVLPRKAARSVEEDWGYSTSSMADVDDDGDDDDGVWGIEVIAVPPMLMKRQLASSGRCL